MENSKKFTDVFKNIEFSTPVKNNVRHIDVNEINHIQKENLLQISGVSKMILCEAEIQKAMDRIKNELGGEYNINIDLTYNIPKETKELIKDFYLKLVNSLKTIKPVTSKILDEADYDIAIINNKYMIEIDVPSNYQFLLKQNKIDTFITECFNNRLKQEIFVNFHYYDVEKKKTSYKEEQGKLLKQAQKDGLIATNISTEQKAITNNNERVDKKKQKRVGSLKSATDLQITGKIYNQIEENEKIVISGEIITTEIKNIKVGKNKDKDKVLVIFDLYDGTSAVTVKGFTAPDVYENQLQDIIKKGKGAIVAGTVQFDNFSNELIVMSNEIHGCDVEREAVFDNRVDKRVELHCHTNMSQMDGVASTKDLIKKAETMGHKAIAITDHGVVQAFPDADKNKSDNIKILYGVEGYLVDDMTYIVKNSKGQSIENSTYVVFDLETTGLSNRMCKIIEIGAVKVVNGEIIDEFSALIDPEEPLSEEITKLTGIKNSEVQGQRKIEDVLPEFFEFVGGSVLVAHNANFDVNFLNKWSKELFGKETDYTYIDTVPYSRLYIETKNRKLNTLCDALGIGLENHHRAVDDSIACANIFIHLYNKTIEDRVNTLDDLNSFVRDSIKIPIDRSVRPKHIIIFAKNLVGLRNLYELISISHLYNFYRRPRIPKSKLLELREGLIIGSACESGEIYDAVFNNMQSSVINEILPLYDYLEVQPLGNNAFMIRKNIATEEILKDVNKEIIALGDKNNMLTVATGDVHYLNKNDNIFRSIILDAEKFKDADEYTPLYYRNTDEMLQEFDYIDEKKALEIVVTNTNKIADMIEDIYPVPRETYPPKMDNSDGELRDICYKKAYSMYGNPLPEVVEKRLERELTSIIKNGFSVMYIIAQKLVKKSVDDGYLVGSRGSVGSSFAATMSDITEVNPLQPHYYCKKCQYTDFDSDVVKEYLGTSGCDMPDKLCPDCGEKLEKDGHDIPFETFLGFDGDKEPDIDLNFSGEYQARAHEYTEELFGKGYVFKAGTIGTLAEKTAYAYVYKYFEKREQAKRKAELNVLASKITGIKKSTGQHPGGLMVVPSDQDIYNFCPVQRPANDVKSDVITTHFEYKAISGRLLKLDILGHDAPTLLRHLYDLTGYDPVKIDSGDKKIISLFTSPKALGVTSEQINCPTGSLGLPEFGTSFVLKMLVDTKPTTFSELCRISGLSHGTDVWLNNAQDLVRDGVATLKEIIPTRDDIMVYLILKGVESKTAFFIMEDVRKGKGLKPEQEEIMREKEIPEWYIESCKKIKYMFPKGHAVAYVMMSVRIGYYKVYYPEAYYCATLSVKYDDIDYATMCKGQETAKKEMETLRREADSPDASKTIHDKITVLENINEMYARGIEFVPIDIYKALPTKFILTDDGKKLMPPLCTIAGLGEGAALSLVEAREKGEFNTLEQLRAKTKISKTVTETMKENNLLKGIPETEQVSLFD